MGDRYRDRSDRGGRYGPPPGRRDYEYERERDSRDGSRGRGGFGRSPDRGRGGGPYPPRSPSPRGYGGYDRDRRRSPPPFRGGYRGGPSSPRDRRDMRPDLRPPYGGYDQRLMDRLADDARGPERQASRPSLAPPSNASNAGQRSGVMPSPARAPSPPSRNADGPPTRPSTQVFRQAPPYNPGGPRDSPAGPPRGPRNPSFGSGPSPGPRGGFRGGAPYRGGFRQGPPPSFMNQRSGVSVASPTTPSWSSPAGNRKQSMFGASHNGSADSPAGQGGEGEKVETSAPGVEESVHPVITRIGRVGYESIRPQLDEEVVRLRREYEELDRKDSEKQKRKRAAISAYDKAERDTTAIAYRVELAEQQLDGMLTGTILFD